MNAVEAPMPDLAPLDRHERVALSFSGGKDSLACVYLLREAGRLDQVTLYHLDTGDLLPEQMAVVDHVRGFAPRFETIRTDVAGWIAQHGLPTDLLPHSAHPVGQAMGEGRRPLVGRYDCCWANLMRPTYERIRGDGNTLLIRGTKRADMRRLPVDSGAAPDGVELFYPLLGWSNAQVFAYLRRVGAPISRVYDHAENSPECATCSAWWSEGRAAYLARFHPGKAAVYQARLQAVAGEILPVLGHFAEELRTPLVQPVPAPVQAPVPADPAALEAASAEILALGHRVLQGNRLAPSEAGHVRVLLDLMDPPPGATVADLGCGFGEVAKVMRRFRPDLDFLLVNNSSAQLQRAPIGPGLMPVQADLHDTGLAPESCDGAMMLYSLCHADLPAALREAARIVAPGGFLFIYDYERTGGTDDLLRAHLHAVAHPREVFEAAAAAAGWGPGIRWTPGGDDSLFRTVFRDPALYARIFADLRPVVWKLARRAA